MNEWISINDRLPSVHEDVLAWSILDNGGYVLATLSSSEKEWFCQPLFGANYRTKGGISHWMPLPKRLDELIGDRL